MNGNLFVKTGISLLNTLPEKPARKIIYGLNALRIKQIYRLKVPRSMTLFLTNRCNAACRHCFYWKAVAGETDELSLAEIGKLVQSLRGAKEINLTGGEPFLRTDLPEIVEMCVASGIKTISIPSNGILTDRIVDFAGKMISIPGLSILKINISLDGPENTHDRIRQVNGCHARATQTIDALKALKKTTKKLKVSVAAVVSRDNFEDMESFIPELFQLKLPLIFSVVRGSDYHTYGISNKLRQDLNPKSSKYLESYEDLERLKALLLKNAGQYGTEYWNIMQQIKFDLLIDMIKNRRKQVPCFSGYADGVIFNDGNVALCEYTRPVGNLRDFGIDFKKVWWSGAANRMRRLKKNCICTHPCNLVSHMQYHPDLVAKIIRNYH